MVPRRDSEGKDTRNLVQAAYTPEEERSIKEWKTELKEWKRGEAIVKQQIAATIPDSLFMKIHNKGTACEIWEALQGDFQNKSRMVAMDLQRRLQQERWRRLLCDVYAGIESGAGATQMSWIKRDCKVRATA